MLNTQSHRQNTKTESTTNKHEDVEVICLSQSHAHPCSSAIILRSSGSAPTSCASAVEAAVEDKTHEQGDERREQEGGREGEQEDT